MNQLLKELNQLDEVKAVKQFGGQVLKIQLYTREIKGSEAVKIHGNLQSLSQKLVNKLDNARERAEIKGWNWIQRPQKQYQETNLGYNSSVTDRKEKGHKPGHYQVSLKK